MSAKPVDASLEFEAPCRIESEANLGGRGQHWAARKRRRDVQRNAVYWSYREAIGPSGTLFARRAFEKAKHLTVTLTRIAPRPITDEHDNLRIGFKGVVDMLAELLARDDGDREHVTWKYRQERGAPKTYAIRVRIESTKS